MEKQSYYKTLGLACWLGLSLFKLQAQVVPVEPANVISNHYSINWNGLPSPILDNTTNIFDVQVNNAVGKIWDVNLRTDLQHTFPGEIRIYLTSPQGTQITLSTDSGSGFDNIFDGTWWDDQATTNVTDAFYVNLITLPTLQPEGALSAFDNENPNGTWSLTVVDDTIANVGSLNGAQLEISTYIGKPTFVTKDYTNNVSIPIPDSASISPTATVTGLPYRISEVKVFTKIPHTFSRDLDVTLTSPAGTIITLVSNRGAGHDNVFDGTWWYDNALTPATDASYANLATQTQLIPEGTLGAFKGENPNGTWTLTVNDDLLNGDTGTLDNWILEITTASAGVNDVNGDGYTDIIGQKKKEVRVLSQQAGQTSSNAISVGKLPKGFKVAGGGLVNGDGLSDLIVQRKTQISYLSISNGVIGKTPVPLATALKRYKARAFGDINSDNHSDIIVTRGKVIAALMGPSNTFQEIIKKNKNGKVVGVVQDNIICQKGKKVYRIPITASGTNTPPTAGAAVTLTEAAAGKVVGVSEINATEGYEIIAQKKKEITYGAWDSGNFTTKLWSDKGKEKSGQIGKVVAPK